MTQITQLNFIKFQENLVETFLKLLSFKEFCDAKLIGEDQILVEAHRFVLSAFSSILKDVVKKLGEGKDEMVMQGMDHEDIRSLLQFMYLGEVSTARAGVNKFLRTAKFLGISQPRDQCNVDTEELNREFGVHLRRREVESEKNVNFDDTTDDDISEDEYMEEQEYRARIDKDYEEKLNMKFGAPRRDDKSVKSLKKGDNSSEDTKYEGMMKEQEYGVRIDKDYEKDLNRKLGAAPRRDDQSVIFRER